MDTNLSSKGAVLGWTPRLVWTITHHPPSGIGNRSSPIGGGAATFPAGAHGNRVPISLPHAARCTRGNCQGWEEEADPARRAAAAAAWGLRRSRLQIPCGVGRRGGHYGPTLGNIRGRGLCGRTDQPWVAGRLKAGPGQAPYGYWQKGSIGQSWLEHPSPPACAPTLNSRPETAKVSGSEGLGCVHRLGLGLACPPPSTVQGGSRRAGVDTEQGHTCLPPLDQAGPRDAARHDQSSIHQQISRCTRGTPSRKLWGFTLDVVGGTPSAPMSCPIHVAQGNTAVWAAPSVLPSPPTTHRTFQTLGPALSSGGVDPRRALMLPKVSVRGWLDANGQCVHTHTHTRVPPRDP